MEEKLLKSKLQFPPCFKQVQLNNYKILLALCMCERTSTREDDSLKKFQSKPGEGLRIPLRSAVHWWLGHSIT